MDEYLESSLDFLDNALIHMRQIADGGLFGSSVHKLTSRVRHLSLTGTGESMSETVTGLEKKVEEFGKRVDSLEVSMNVLGEKMNSLEAKVVEVLNCTKKVLIHAGAASDREL